MRVDDDRLRVGIANDADALIAHEVSEFVLEARAEIVTLEAMNAAIESALGVEGDETGATCAEM